MGNMAINTNVLALNSHRALKNVGNTQAKSQARLSTGQKINSAADDAAGLAISEKMRSQIRGLDMASKNSQDAISLIQTAEGGMQEIDNMLQRVRELTVNAANDTNEHNTLGTGDRQKMQDEVNNLVQEMDSMSDRVEFNKKKLINGDSEMTPINKTITSALNSAKAAANISQEKVNTDSKALHEADTSLNMSKDAFMKLANDSNDNGLKGLYDKISSITDTAGNNGVDAALTAFKTAMDNYFTSVAGAADTTAIGTASTALAGMTGVVKDLTDALAAAAANGDNISTTQADAMSTALNNLVSNGGVLSTAADSVSTALANQKTANTNLVASNAQLATDLKALSVAQGNYNNAPKTGGLHFQVGANANQSIQMSIGSLKTDVLGIGDGKGKTNIDFLKATGADITNTLTKLDTALSYVTTERSKLGAVQNRLEYTQKSLDISSENLSAAESRIRDTDMAKEMMNLTKANVLQNAAVSMLSQANQAPQTVLQLLR